MDESLKAVQVMHRSLLALAAALLIFSISADRSKGIYQAALDELHGLQQAMPKVTQARLDEESEAYAGSQLGAAIRQEASKRQILEKPQYIVAIEEDQRQFTPPMYAQTSRQIVDDLYNYIKTAPGFDTANLYAFDERQLTRAVASALSRSDGPIEKVYVRFDKAGADGIPRAQRVVDHVPLEALASPTGIVEHGGVHVGDKVILQDQLGQYKQVGKCVISIEPEEPIGCRVDRTIRFNRAIAILRNEKLFTDENGYILPLPALSKVWDDIAGKEMRVAEGILERKAGAEKSSQERTINVLGLSLGTEGVAILGPALELLIALYLLAHVRHVHSFKDRDPEKIRAFPDIGIAAGTVGTTVILFSIVVLPLAAGDLVISRFSISGHVERLLLAAFSLVWLGVSAICVASIKQLGK
jgi:hypothetical protein